MSKSKSSISKARSYKEIGEFWDTHDLAEYWEQTRPVEFEIDIQSEVTYYALDLTLSAKVHFLAKQRGISPETLLNLWVQEKLQEEKIQSAEIMEPSLSARKKVLKKVHKKVRKSQKGKPKSLETHQKADEMV